MCKLSAVSAPCHLQLLNCIMDMVEKTRRSLTVLRRCQEADREELNYWIRRYSDAEELKKGAVQGQSRQQSPAAQENATPGGGSLTVHVSVKEINIAMFDGLFKTTDLEYFNVIHVALSVL